MTDMLDYDQLTSEIRYGHVFQGFSEGQITFPPTFKYDKRSHQFDTSAKSRCPAWTDRVLYTADSPLCLEIQDYCCYDARTSDHRPVCAKFTLAANDDNDFKRN